MKASKDKRFNAIFFFSLQQLILSFFSLQNKDEGVILQMYYGITFINNSIFLDKLDQPHFSIL